MASLVQPGTLRHAAAGLTMRPCMRRAAPHAAGLQRRRICVRPTAAAGTGSSGASFSEGAQRFASEAQQRVGSFVKDYKLDEKAAEAGKEAQKKLGEGWQEAQENLRRATLKLDSEYDVSSKAKRAARQAREAATDIDQRWGVRRRLRAVLTDAQTRLPVWRRQVSAFGATRVGKIALVTAAVLLIGSGAVWPLLHLVWLLWWLSVPITMYIVDQARRKAAAGGGGAQAQQGGGGGNGGRSAHWRDGPVVDAQFTEVTSDSKKR